MIEEEIFYPAFRGKIEGDTLDEAYVEHDGAKVLINDIEASRPEDDFYDAKVHVLSEEIKHHVKEEEMPSEGMFAQCRKTDVDLVALGEKMWARAGTAHAGQDQRSGARTDPSGPSGRRLRPMPCPFPNLPSLSGSPGFLPGDSSAAMPWASKLTPACRSTWNGGIAFPTPSRSCALCASPMPTWRKPATSSVWRAMVTAAIDGHADVHGTNPLAAAINVKATS